MLAPPGFQGSTNGRRRPALLRSELLKSTPLNNKFYNSPRENVTLLFPAKVSVLPFFWSGFQLKHFFGFVSTVAYRRIPGLLKGLRLIALEEFEESREDGNWKA